jgi:hypothetical protein
MRKILARDGDCDVVLEDGMVVKACNGETEKICVFGTESENGGFKIMGTGGSVGRGRLRIKCFSVKDILKKMK